MFFEVQDCDRYALPTLRDGPPVAILEAMFAGLPVLCPDIGATCELVPDGAGFKLAVQSREQIGRGIAHTLKLAAEHKTELYRMGCEGRAYARPGHDWQKIGDRIQALYSELLAGRSPVF